MSKRRKIHRMTNSFDVRAYAKRLDVPMISLTDSDVDGSVDGMRACMINAILHAAWDPMFKWLDNIDKCIEEMRVE